MSSLWHWENDAVRIRKICVGAYENNCFIVACRETDDAVIVDAAAEPDRILAAVADVTPHAILTTHGHFDHVEAARQVADVLSIPFRLHPDDAELAGMEPDEPLSSGDIVVGATALRAVHTPGHTAGSMSFVAAGAVLTGDTLFPGGPGATMSKSSSFEQIIASIEQHLFTLPDDTLVMPGHGLDTTIGAERPHLAEWIERGW